MHGRCTACGHSCNVVLIDFGVGPYEFWGHKGVDVAIEAVSACCEDIAVDDTGNEITWQMIAQNKGEEK